MKAISDIDRLRTRRRRLVVLYVAFVLLFSSSCAMATSGMTHGVTLASFGISALVALPLYVVNVLVHLATRAIKPNANTVGLKQLVASIVCLTPIEAALVLPAINLYVSRNVLASYRDSVAARPEDSFKPKPFRGSARIRRQAARTQYLSVRKEHSSVTEDLVMATKKKSTSTKSNNGWKTCSRGHKYRGSGPCPICWPGGTRKK